MSSPVISRAQVLGAALLFSTGGTLIKAISFSGWQVACFRSGIAAIALYVTMRNGRRLLQPGILLVGLAYALTMIAFVTANKLTTAANTIFLQSTAPIYLLLLGPWLLKERIRRSDLAFTAALVVGMLLFFVGVIEPQSTAPDPLLGNLIATLAGLTWALTILGLRWLGRSPQSGQETAGTAVLAGNLIACLICLPLAFPAPAGTPTDWVLVMFLGVFQIGLAYVLLTRAVARVSAIEASLLLLLEPVASTIWAWLYHGERPGSWALVGCVVIIVTTVLMTLRRGQREPAG
jgi:DME family drug/metabolite transporter